MAFSHATESHARIDGTTASRALIRSPTKKFD